MFGGGHMGGGEYFKCRWKCGGNYKCGENHKCGGFSIHIVQMKIY